MATRLQEKAVGGEGKIEMERKKKNPPKSGLWVSEVNDQRGLERGKDEAGSLET